MSSKFYGLKGKLNKINKEVKEKAVVQAEAAAAVEETATDTNHAEIVTLLESLNDSDTLDKAEAAVTPVVEVLEDTTESVLRNTMSHIAYNIYWDNIDRAYHLCTMEYNLSRNEVKIVGTKRIADNPSVALHKLNGLIALKLLKREEVY